MIRPSRESHGLRALKQIGGKFRLVPQLAKILHGTGAELLVDVFGGTGAVTMNAGFTKRIYNDLDGDFVNFFRVIRDPDKRRAALWRLRNFPMSRQEFEAIRDQYTAAPGLGFGHLDDVTRAVYTFYRSNYAFGGKFRSGGFSCSTGDRDQIKELSTYQARLRSFARLADFWRDTVIEHLDFQDLISSYGDRERTVLFCDPPYFGTEGYYTHRFSQANHAFLASQLAGARAAAVVTYYDFEGLEDLYPADQWTRLELESTKNSMTTGLRTEKATEVVLVKQDARRHQTETDTEHGNETTQENDQGKAA